MPCLRLAGLWSRWFVDDGRALHDSWMVVCSWFLLSARVSVCLCVSYGAVAALFCMQYCVRNTPALFHSRIITLLGHISASY